MFQHVSINASAKTDRNSTTSSCCFRRKPNNCLALRRSFGSIFQSQKPPISHLPEKEPLRAFEELLQGFPQGTSIGELQVDQWPACNRANTPILLKWITIIIIIIPYPLSWYILRLCRQYLLSLTMRTCYHQVHTDSGVFLSSMASLPSKLQINDTVISSSAAGFCPGHILVRRSCRPKYLYLSKSDSKEVLITPTGWDG